MVHPALAINTADIGVASGTTSVINRFRSSLRWSRYARKQRAAVSSVTDFKAIRYVPETGAPTRGARPPLAIVESGDTTSSLIPEFRHLAIHSEQHRLSDEQITARKVSRSSDHLTKTRRFAKTPVFAISDLERALSRRRNTPLAVNTGTSEVAGTCCGFREIVDANSLYSTETIDSTTPHIPHLVAPRRSPTLRRRKSFGPFVAGSTDPFFQRNDLSLQICLELLTDELSAATTRLSDSCGNETSELRLPLWLMIEVYEHLRDRLLGCMSRNREERERLTEVRAMFDVWVRALQTIYENLGVVSSDAHRLPDVVDEIVD
ncbi:hypothetical protein MFIFM68171_00884 [Madurella fahalii]|uniref:Uncharacterized protein n=1 Tax=Madurella fahalii TaxID=1157608 RepID=A0ABQ0FYV3_9PEZI